MRMEMFIFKEYDLVPQKMTSRFGQVVRRGLPNRAYDTRHVAELARPRNGSSSSSRVDRCSYPNEYIIASCLTTTSAESQ